MITIKINELTRTQVRALTRCSDLISDGYRECFSAVLADHWFIRLRHTRNGRGLIVRVYNDRYTVSEGKEIIESWHDVLT